MFGFVKTPQSLCSVPLRRRSIFTSFDPTTVLANNRSRPDLLGSPQRLARAVVIFFGAAKKAVEVSCDQTPEQTTERTKTNLGKTEHVTQRRKRVWECNKLLSSALYTQPTCVSTLHSANPVSDSVGLLVSNEQHVVVAGQSRKVRHLLKSV